MQFDKLVDHLLTEEGLTPDEQEVDCAICSIGERVDYLCKGWKEVDIPQIISSTLKRLDFPSRLYHDLLMSHIANEAAWSEEANQQTCDPDDFPKYYEPIKQYLTKLAAPYTKLKSGGGNIDLLDI